MAFTQCADRPERYGGAEPLGHDALAPQSAGFAKYNRAILLEILIEHDAQMRAFEQLGEQRLALRLLHGGAENDCYSVPQKTVQMPAAGNTFRILRFQRP